MSDELFESAYFLFQGAAEDVQKYIAAEHAFAADPEARTKVFEMDPKTGDKIIKMRFLKRPPPQLRRHAYRIVSDLRHALDQAVFAAVKRVTRAEPPYDVYFPFATHPNDLAAKLRKIPAELHAFFERQEPYETGNGYEGGNNILRLLGTLAGPNKHQVALRVRIDINMIQWNWVFGYNYSALSPSFDSTKHEVPLFRIHPGGKVDYNVFIPLNISVDHPKAKGISFIDLAVAWLDTVQKIISSLEDEANGLAR